MIVVYVLNVGTEKMVGIMRKKIKYCYDCNGFKGNKTKFIEHFKKRHVYVIRKGVQKYMICIPCKYYMNINYMAKTKMMEIHARMFHYGIKTDYIEAIEVVKGLK